MQVHRINANTIKVSMNAEELKERGITILDLLGNKDEIQKFFYDILSEVDTEHEFTKEQPVTFQVMPSNSGLELLISKVPDGEEKPKSNKDDPLRQLLEGLGEKNFKPANADTIFGSSNGKSESSKEDLNSNRRIFKFENIDSAISLADALVVPELASSLYVYRHTYYLDCAFLDSGFSEIKPSDAWVIANEFGQGMTEKEFAPIKKMGKCLIRQDALNNLRQYFD
ncbi:adaptor protein MecA [Lactobacillus sp. PV012]|uniref:adaptor protein MecA n=1 Tax=Lactobacillus sp. PV012 TaxID=2594494 RepID=UPI00223ED7E4|nr:adaptor protein MecA [Lactobacillus sp. PV012]QNQ82589.1 adaptor protein MecA [Lactobacillus sp. PV012]